MADREPAPRLRLAAPSPAFSYSDEDGWLVGWRVTLGAKAVRGLSARAPDATLDLHGMSLDEARRAVVGFARARRARGDEVVCLVVGKGRHSQGGVGVLRGAVADWLTTPPICHHVLGFVSAAPRRGGSGAVMVLLQRHRSPRPGEK